MAVQISKPPVLACILAFTGLCVLLSLGTWQAQKYFAITENSENKACERQTAVLTRAYFHKINDDNPYIHCKEKIALQAITQDDISIARGPRVHDGQPGYHIYKPLVGDDGSTILVNFGWSSTKDMQLNTARITTIGNAVKLSGRNFFTPDNSADKNEWFWIDLEAIQQRYNLSKMSDYVFFATSINPDNLEAFTPAELSKSYLTPQTHIQYAGFWYFMALALLVIFILRFVVVKKAD